MIRKGTGISFYAWHVEMDMAGGVMIDWVVGGLIPDIFKIRNVDTMLGCEARNISYFIIFDDNGFGSSIDIENEESVFF